MKPTNPHLSLDRQIIGDIYTTTEVMANLTILCDDFGSRFGGTLGEKQAADFMKAKLEEYGLSNVHLEPIEYIGWRRGDVKLELLEPMQLEIPCITLPVRSGRETRLNPSKSAANRRMPNTTPSPAAMERPVAEKGADGSSTRLA